MEIARRIAVDIGMGTRELFGIYLKKDFSTSLIFSKVISSITTKNTKDFKPWQIQKEQILKSNVKKKLPCTLKQIMKNKRKINLIALEFV